MSGGVIHSTVEIRHSSFIQIHVATFPSPATDARPLVLLHGIWDTWRSFERVATRLARGRTVHALDLRGHGESSKPDEGYAHADYAADVLGVLDALALAQVDLLGFSLGAMVATRLVADRPERIARLVLEDPPYSPGADPRGRLAWFATLLDLKRQPFEDVVEGLSELNPTRDRATNELSARALIDCADGPFHAQLDPKSSRFDLPATLACVTFPVLILRADPEFGGAMNEAGRDECLVACPAARLVEFPGCGHLIHAEREDNFVAAVEDFLGAR